MHLWFVMVLNGCDVIELLRLKRVLKTPEIIRTSVLNIRFGTHCAKL